MQIHLGSAIAFDCNFIGFSLSKPNLTNDFSTLHFFPCFFGSLLDHYKCAYSPGLFGRLFFECVAGPWKHCAAIRLCCCSGLSENRRYSYIIRLRLWEVVFSLTWAASVKECLVSISAGRGHLLNSDCCRRWRTRCCFLVRIGWEACHGQQWAFHSRYCLSFNFSGMTSF